VRKREGRYDHEVQGDGASLSRSEKRCAGFVQRQGTNPGRCAGGVQKGGGYKFHMSIAKVSSVLRLPKALSINKMRQGADTG